MELQYSNSTLLSQSFFKMIGHLLSFKQVNFRSVTFYFTIYKNGVPGEGKSLERKTIGKVFKNSYDNGSFPILKTYSDCELGVNSLLIINKKKYHLPLIDFSYPEWDDVFIKALLELKEKYPGNIYIFDSGRSFHGYHDILLSETKWRKYLGELLLLNKKDCSSEIIDSRWIGHSIIQGYSCLRISHNTQAYLKMPKFKCKL